MKKWLTVGILVLALLGLCAAILAVFWISLGSASQGRFHLEVFQVNTISAEADEEKRFTLNGPATLTVENTAGNIIVAAGEGNEMIVSAHKTAWGNSKDDAESSLAELTVNMTQDGNAITVKAKRPETVVIASSGHTENTVDFTITVPKETSVTIHTGFGEITLSGTRGSASLESDYGDISVTNVEGNLKGDTSSGKVEVQDVKAGTASVDLRSDYGDITLKRCSAGAIKMTSSSGELSLENVEASGEITLDSDYGDINFATGSAAKLDIDASSGKIGLATLTVEGTLTAHSSYGDITLEQDKAGTYDLSASSGAVIVNGASGKLIASSGYGNVKVTSGDHADLDLKTNSGKVEYSGSLGEGPHTLHSDYGNVLITLPEGTALNFDLKTDYGKVKSALPVTISGDLEETHWLGTINGGGASLTATTKSGDIRIEILKP